MEDEHTRTVGHWDAQSNSYFFSGVDAAARLWLFLAWVGYGVLPLPLVIGGIWDASAGWLSVGLMVCATFGARASISVKPGWVRIQKTWFGIPYYWKSGEGIEALWFGGDWGEAEGAECVEVTIGGVEIYIGSPKTMLGLRHELERYVLSSRGPEHERAHS